MNFSPSTISSETIDNCCDTKVRKALSKLTNDSDLIDEILQETQLKAHRKLHTFRGDHDLTSLISWLRRIALNCLVDEMKKKSWERNGLLEYFQSQKHANSTLDTSVKLSERIEISHQLISAFKHALEYATPLQRDRFEKVVFEKAHSERGGAARLAAVTGVSKSRISTCQKKTTDTAIAGMYMNAARSRNIDALSLLFTDEFMSWGPDKADVLNKFRYIIEREKQTTDASHSLVEDFRWLYCQTRESLIQFCSRNNGSDDDLWRVRSYYLPMRVACQLAGKSLQDEHRDTWKEMRTLLESNSQLRREMATHGGYCQTEVGDSIRSREKTDADLEVAGVMVYLMGCRKSKLDFPSLYRGSPLPILKRLNRSGLDHDRAIEKLIDYSVACIQNKDYQKPGIAGMVISWGHWVLDRANQASPRVAKTLDKYFNELVKHQTHFTNHGQLHGKDYTSLLDKAMKSRKVALEKR